MALAYLLDPCLQHQNRDGVNAVGGWFEVFLDDTDDHATVYSDFDGTLCPERIGIDNNGRAVMIVDSARAYRVEMHDRTGNLLYTQYPVWTQKSGGGVTGVKVESTDGTVDVQKTTAGGVTIYDLSTQVTEDASRWGGIVMRGTGVEGDGMWHPVQVDSTQGPAPYATGWTVEKDCVADIAAALEFSCDNRDALNTIDVQCEFVLNGTVDRTEGGMLDPTRPKGRVSFEYKGAVSEGDKIDCRIYVRCNQDVTLFLGGYAVYNEEVDGVVGGGSGGGAYEAGDFVEITSANVINVTGLQPTSADSVAIGDGNTATSYSLAQGYDNTASINSVSQGFKNTALNNSFSQGYLNYASDYSVAQGYGNTAMDYSFTQGLRNGASFSSFAQGKDLEASNRAAVFGRFNLDGQGSGPSGIALAIGDGSASSARHNLFEIRKNGTVTVYSSTADTAGTEIISTLQGKADLSGMSAYQPVSGMSAYATTVDLSSKLDASASSSFIPVSASGDFVPYSAVNVVEV